MLLDQGLEYKNNEIDEARRSSGNMSHFHLAQTSYVFGHRWKRQTLFSYEYPYLAQSLTETSRVLSFQPGKQDVSSYNCLIIV